MSKARPKIDGGATDSKRSVRATPAGRVSQLQEEIDSTWKAALESLEDKEFASLDQAIDEILNLVLQKLQIQGSSEAETREFLIELFESDPALKAEIQAILNVG